MAHRPELCGAGLQRELWTLFTSPKGFVYRAPLKDYSSFYQARVTRSVSRKADYKTIKITKRVLRLWGVYPWLGLGLREVGPTPDWSNDSNPQGLTLNYKPP